MSVFQALQRAARPAAVAVMLAAFGAAAGAQQPPAAAVATAKELIAATGATAMFNPLIPGVVEQAKLLYLQQDPALAPDLNVVAAKIRNDLQPRFAEITDEVAVLYAKNFSEQELKEILAFYKTPTGQKLLKTQPTIISSSMDFARNWANTLSEQVVAKIREEMKKKGHNL
jgi:hypothetical protein